MEVSVLQVERSAQLKAQLLECEERTRWMSTHSEELKQQLRHTQQGLLHTRCLFPVTYPSWTHAYLSVTVLCPVSCVVEVTLFLICCSTASSQCTEFVKSAAVSLIPAFEHCL